MFEMIYNELIKKDLKSSIIGFGNILKNIRAGNQETKERISNLIMSLILTWFEVDGIKIKKNDNDKEIANFSGRYNDYFVNPRDDFQIEQINDQLKFDNVTLEVYKYTEKNELNKIRHDILKKITGKDIQTVFSNLLEINFNNNEDTRSKQDALLGYVFHLYDFVENEKQKKIEKILESLEKNYKDDPRFSLINNMLENIEKKINKEVEQQGLGTRLNVQFAIGHDEGSGSYFFFPKIFEKFVALDGIESLEKMIKSPTVVMTKQNVGMLSRLREPYRLGTLWTIYNEEKETCPKILSYIYDDKALWEIEKKVFFANFDDANALFFMGALPFISFKRMHLYVYLVGKIQNLHDLNVIRKINGYLSFYLFSISEHTKNMLKLLENETEKSVLKKHYISRCLQGKDLLDLVSDKTPDYETYVNNLLSSYMLHNDR